MYSSSSFNGSMIKDPDFVYNHSLICHWFKRLISQKLIDYDDDFFECIDWCCGGLDWLITWLKDYSLNKYGKEIDLDSSTSRYLPRSYILSRFIVDHPEFYFPTLKQVSLRLEESITKDVQKPKMVSAIQDFFGLNSTAITICTYLFVHELYGVIRYFFRDLDIDRYENFYYLAKILDIPFDTFKNQVYNLYNIGIVECNYLSLNYKLELIWNSNIIEGLEKSFCQKVDTNSVPLEECNVNASDREIVLRILRQKNKSPKHILLYGSPGSGKTTFARSLIQELGVNAWSVPCHVDDTPSERRTALMACVRIAKNHPGSFVLVDEAEVLLDTDIGQHFGRASPKDWLNPFLEQQDLRIIWITNKVNQLDQAVRRRFTFSINFTELSQKQRATMWQRIASRLGVSDLSASQIKRLAELYPVQVAVMENAMVEAKTIASSENFFHCLEHLLKAQVTLQNDGQETWQKPNQPLRFDVKAACTAQPLEPLITSWRNLDQQMRNYPEKKLTGLATMLFYGPPGTGKTALARHLAHLFDRICIIKRASDLLDRHVGETERNIAQAFKSAASDDAVLVIDEADSFLQERHRARHNWELTQVNEFLTQLEHFAGFCICTTNFREIMDSAAMRRFSYKVQFSYAKPPQLEALYLGILAPLVHTKTPPEILGRLKLQTMLTPGDFAAVYRQFWIANPKNLTHEVLIKALLHEQKLKLEANQVQLGF